MAYEGMTARARDVLKGMDLDSVKTHFGRGSYDRMLKWIEDYDGCNVEVEEFKLFNRISSIFEDLDVARLNDSDARAVTDWVHYQTDSTLQG